MYELALRSTTWHQLEHLCFLTTALLFWWPIIQPWPLVIRVPRWTIIPYLFLADFQNTALSAFLMFYERVLYPIVDARVFLELENGAGKTVRAEATHRLARNKLLYCSLINLPEAGHWKMKITIEYGDERAEVLDHLMVANPQPMLLAYWKLITFPPMVIILFIINHWLRRMRVHKNKCGCTEQLGKGASRSVNSAVGKGAVASSNVS
jgi:hypothetical protein